MDPSRRHFAPPSLPPSLPQSLPSISPTPHPPSPPLPHTPLHLRRESRHRAGKVAHVAPIPISLSPVSAGTTFSTRWDYFLCAEWYLPHDLVAPPRRARRSSRRLLVGREISGPPTRRPTWWTIIDVPDGGKLGPRDKGVAARGFQLLIKTWPLFEIHPGLCRQ